MFRSTMILLGLTSLLTACGGGGSDAISPPPPPAPASQALGGLWTGLDVNGNEIYALSTDSGQLRWVEPATGEQGFGTGTAVGTALTINYTYVAPLGSTLADGSATAACAGTGTIQQRQSLAAAVDCTTDLGGTFSTSATLAYDALYDRDSSLATIAGSFGDAAAVVFTIAADGALFAQDPVSGCVINGQFGVVDTQYNAYDLSVSYSSCAGAGAILNGVTFTGLAILDNTVSPETVFFGMTGDVSGATISNTFALPRI